MSSSLSGLCNHHLVSIGVNTKKRRKENLTKAELENKKLVKTLKQKIFKGYNKIKELNKKKPNTFNHLEMINSPITQWQKECPYPFEDKYYINYRKQFLSKLDDNKLDNALNIVKMNSLDLKKLPILTESKRNTFLTTKNKPQLMHINNSNSNNNKINTQYLMKQIFPNEEETKKINSLRFFAINKNPWEYSNQYGNVNNDPYIEAEFMYKISRPERQRHMTLNFASNKGLKKGLTSPNFLPNNNNKIENKKLQSNLNIQIENLSDNKTLTLNQKREQMLLEKINILKNAPGEIIKDFEDELFSEDDKENSIISNKEDKVVDKAVNLNLSQISNSTKNINPKMKTWEMFYKELQPKGRENLKSLSSTKYNEKQINYRKERFKYIQSLAFGDSKSSNHFQDKDKDKDNLKVVGFIDPNSRLLIQTKKSYKELYKKESKIYDLKIANKLKGLYDKRDIERLLNGRSPFPTDNPF